MRVKTWRIIDRGHVPTGAPHVEFMCVHCGHEAMLPVVGLAIAQVGDGLVFDRGRYETPDVIQCRRCGRVLTTREDMSDESAKAHVR